MGEGGCGGNSDKCINALRIHLLIVHFRCSSLSCYVCLPRLLKVTYIGKMMISGADIEAMERWFH